ncbi:BZ3500_MvSof-1268-A1-R1_Chr7-1g09401 [Microbotryum saponariae]|uniref:BZ3500_MvSof-1268-A1-R1_Chr7-1g09401 protein n=1 Tax=Microbotryum saponariae TaxID=289078 RepID=A0A2X0MX48_9BASI|nr:BZ3501_MvSof-1269-A2-R1_Chr7-1g09106 [Microbotryum saponariae]SDA03370.1 BZ3500_MvSof-1268-A1-R1_Chr7-1g09401 [Microbotryum saponariae]
MDGVTATKLKMTLSLDLASPYACPVLPLLAIFLENDAFESTPQLDCLATLRLDKPVPLVLRPGVLDRYVSRASERGNTSMTGDTPCGCDWFGRTLQALGTALGWVVTHTLYVWRGFPANAINVPEVTVAERRLLMGHSADLTAYERYYQSRRTKVDTRAPFDPFSLDSESMRLESDLVPFTGPRTRTPPS